MTVAEQELRGGPTVEGVALSAYTVPTDAPESDGTFEWDATTLVVVEVEAGGETGLGWSYTAAAAASLIEELLVPIVCGADAFAIGATHRAMRRSLRNAGYPGLGAMAASAVDVALWDLTAKVLGTSLATLLGRARAEVEVYGSGGFCSYSDERLGAQLGGWVDDGIPRVKMKVGREPARDRHRVELARRAIGDDAELFVDANGALAVKQALRFGEQVERLGVRWFEEPVSADDLDGLRLLRERLPPGMEVAAGEYAATPADFRRLAPAVDCLQADATRCGGITGFLQAGSLGEALERDLSAHCAPTIHLHAMCAVPRARHIEWFHDHVRIERLFFDGFPEPEQGIVRPDLSRPGLGVELKRADAARYLR